MHTPKRLLVEGSDDLHAVIALMRANGVPLSQKREESPVGLEPFGGIPVLLRMDYLSGQLKASSNSFLGLVVDADEQPARRRWQQIRQRALAIWPNLPEDLPSGGLVTANQRGGRFGVWIMPDNASHGMLETFLALLRPTGTDALWRHAGKATAGAVKIGAPLTKAHYDKGAIHAWLAWQEPPGMPFGTALTATCLKPDSPCAQSFVQWFKNLYDL